MIGSQAGQFIRRRCSYALRSGFLVAIGVFVMAFLAAGYAYVRYPASLEDSFASQVQLLQKLTFSIWEDSVHTTSHDQLSTIYRYEARRGPVSQIAIIDSDEVLISQDIDQVGLQPEFALRRTGLSELLASVVDNESAHQPQQLEPLEAIVLLPTVKPTHLTWLYIAVDAEALSHGAMSKSLGVVKIGFILAVAAGLLTHILLHHSLMIPLLKLQKKVERDGLSHSLKSHTLGELQKLAQILEKATTRLLEDENIRHRELKDVLDKTGEESLAQTELLAILVRDLRVSMSAILGHAELLITGDPRPADRVNYIRAIQSDAKRIARLAHKLQIIMSHYGQTTELETQADLPVDQLRQVIEQLRRASPSVIQLSTSHADGSKPDTENLRESIEPQYTASRMRLSGSVLVVGRADESCLDVEKKLLDLGVHCVKVPDVPSLALELEKTAYDIVILNLTRHLHSQLDVLTQIRVCYATGPVIALLPDWARGDGDRLIESGFSDFIYAMQPRQSLLVCLGKYLGFKPESSAPPTS